MKAFAVLNPAGKVSDEVASDADMAGPLIIAMFLGFLLLAVRQWGLGGLYYLVCLCD